MTEKHEVEARVVSFKKGKDGVTFVNMLDDPSVYFIEGKHDLKEGELYKLTLVRGEGDLAGCFKIIDYQLMSMNVALDKQQRGPGKPAVNHHVSMHIDDFNKLIEAKQLRNRSKIEAFKIAVSLYSEIVNRVDMKDLDKHKLQQIADDVGDLALLIEKQIS